LQTKTWKKKLAMNNIANMDMEEGRTSTNNVTYINIKEDITTLV
jgi:hypothetical protein